MNWEIFDVMILHCLLHDTIYTSIKDSCQIKKQMKNPYNKPIVCRQLSAKINPSNWSNDMTRMKRSHACSLIRKLCILTFP